MHSLTQERARPQGHVKGEVKGEQGRKHIAAAEWDERDAPVDIPDSVGQVVVRGVLGYVGDTFVTILAAFVFLILFYLSGGRPWTLRTRRYPDV